VEENLNLLGFCPRKPEMDEGVAKELENKLREKTGFKDEIPRTLQKGCNY
jgi:hypothetical protein